MTTRKRVRTTTGTFKADDQSTPDTNEAWVEETEVKAETEAVAAEEPIAEETPAEEVKAEAPAETPKSKEPVQGELHESTPANTLKAPQAADDIHAKIRAKLDKRTPGNENGSLDPFNPAASVAVTKTQLESMAEEGGFQLNRGREVGLRLLARAKQNRR